MFCREIDDDNQQALPFHEGFCIAFSPRDMGIILPDFYLFS